MPLADRGKVFLRQAGTEHAPGAEQEQELSSDGAGPAAPPGPDLTRGHRMYRLDLPPGDGIDS